MQSMQFSSMIKMEGEKNIFNLTRGRKKISSWQCFMFFWTKTIYFYQVLEDVIISFMEELLERFLVTPIRNQKHTYKPSI